MDGRAWGSLAWVGKIIKVSWRFSPQCQFYDRGDYMAVRRWMPSSSTELTNNYIRTPWYSRGGWCVDCSWSCKGRHRGWSVPQYCSFAILINLRPWDCRPRFQFLKCDALSSAQESALIFEEYQALESHELVNLAEVIFYATPNPTRFQNWSLKEPYPVETNRLS